MGETFHLFTVLCRMSLTPWNNQRNPWYGDYWQEIFGCVLPHNSVQSTTSNGPPPSPPSATVNSSNLPICSPNLRMSQHVAGYEQDSKIQFVIDAVYAFAHAISALQRDVCGGGRRRNGPCPALLNYDGGDFYTKYLLNVSFIGINFATFHNGNIFHFFSPSHFSCPLLSNRVLCPWHTQ